MSMKLSPAPPMGCPAARVGSAFQTTRPVACTGALPGSQRTISTSPFGRGLSDLMKSPPLPMLVTWSDTNIWPLIQSTRISTS